MEETKYQRLLDEAKQYAQLQYDYLRLELLEKMSRIIAMILLRIAAVIISIGIFIYLSFAFVLWLRPFFDSLIVPLLIVCALFVAILILVFVFHKQLFLNPIIKQLSSIFFRNNTKENSHAER